MIAREPYGSRDSASCFLRLFPMFPTLDTARRGAPHARAASRLTAAGTALYRATAHYHPSKRSQGDENPLAVALCAVIRFSRIRLKSRGDRR
jgi:hypothetical protein